MSRQVKTNATKKISMALCGLDVVKTFKEQDECLEHLEDLELQAGEQRLPLNVVNRFRNIDVKKIVKGKETLTVEAEFLNLSRYGGHVPRADDYFYLATCTGDNASAQFVMRDVDYLGDSGVRVVFDCAGFSKRIDNYVQKNGLKNEIQRKLMAKIGEYMEQSCVENAAKPLAACSLSLQKNTGEFESKSRDAPFAEDKAEL